MDRYQNLEQKPELFRAPSARAPLGPGSGTTYPLNLPIAGPGSRRQSNIKARETHRHIIAPGPHNDFPKNVTGTVERRLRDTVSDLNDPGIEP